MINCVATFALLDAKMLLSQVRNFSESSQFSTQKHETWSASARETVYKSKIIFQKLF